MEYIPVVGKKEYCDKIRELSGAMDKNKKVRRLHLIWYGDLFKTLYGFFKLLKNYFELI